MSKIIKAKLTNRYSDNIIVNSLESKKAID